ncbi:MAG TPA: DUF4231 domain-containing protein [Noviherbaspirillum sp.]
MDDKHYPALYRSSDKLSLDSQRDFFRALWSHLACLVSAAVISVINSTEAEMAVLQAVVLFGALGFALFLGTQKPEKLWYGGRAVAESIKTITWRFITRAEPFDSDENRARDLFIKKLKLLTFTEN